jgi:hypothetical protein
MGKGTFILTGKSDLDIVGWVWYFQKTYITLEIASNSEWLSASGAHGDFEEEKVRLEEKRCMHAVFVSYLHIHILTFIYIYHIMYFSSSLTILNVYYLYT